MGRNNNEPMARAVWKGPFFQMSLLNAIKNAGGKEVKVTAKNNTILPVMVGARLLVHNGKEYRPLLIREAMVGHQIGEYIMCTKPYSYRATNANKKK